MTIAVELKAKSQENDITNNNVEQNSVDVRKTPWKSIWLVNALILVCGIQFSIYFTSAWPYMTNLDPSISLHFLGWVSAAYSAGQAMSAPLFGFWSQKRRCTVTPVCVGMVLTAIGNLLYANLHLFETAKVRWLIIVARLIVGFGAGTLSVLRAYVATASVPADRSRAVALGFASFVIGMAAGPAVQAAFTPIGRDGVDVWVAVVNMYTAPAYFMIAFALLTLIPLNTIFTEEYAGVLNDKKEDRFKVIPKFDVISAMVCMYLWFAQSTVITTIEVIAAPLTIAMYDWKDSQAVLYNGLIQAATAAVHLIALVLLAFTRVGKIDNRKMIIFALLCFIAYHVINMPWPFYNGPLDYMAVDPNTTVETPSFSGGCYARYTWCAHTKRVPMPVYIFCVVIFFGIAFPCNAQPLGTVFSKILGPRRQGTMQGLFAFFGSVARFAAPLYATAIFERYGYIGTVLTELILLVIAFILMCVFYRRIVPLNMVPPIAVPTAYKSGVFYRF